MTAAQDYYERILAMGHPPEQALTYTRQHYPDFVPGAPAPLTSPQPTPQVVKAGSSPAKAYAAAALLLIGALLSVAAQFNHQWLVQNEENALGLSAGLNTVRADCAEAMPLGNFSQEEATDLCKGFAHLFFADDMEAALDAAATENRSVDDLDDVFVGNQDVFCNNVESYLEDYEVMLAIQRVFGGTPELEPTLHAFVSSSYICFGVGQGVSSDDQWGDNTRAGLVLWSGSIVAFLGTGLLISAAAGRGLPGNIERHGKWAGFVAGVVMLAAMGSSGVVVAIATETVSYGMGVWMIVLGGVLGLVAGVLAFMDQK